MDFEKLRPAAEEIKLSEIQKERIIEACEKQKRKSFNYKLWIPVAAAAMFVVVIFSPGFIFRAGKSADNAEAEAPEDGKGSVYNYAADEEYIVEDYLADGVCSVQNQSTAFGTEPLFDSGIYREIYSVIPPQFIWLVDNAEYEKWEKTVSASDGMAMLQFVEHFGITREEFDSANESYQAYINSVGEEREIFNADIIYSFDRERINEYYLAK